MTGLVSMEADDPAAMHAVIMTVVSLGLRHIAVLPALVAQYATESLV